MTATSTALKQLCAQARPLIEQWLDASEQIAALREIATAQGLDWSQLKALLKAQIQDEQDETGTGKRVARIIEKADYAASYADILGLGNLSEKKYSRQSGTDTVSSRQSGAATGEGLGSQSVNSVAASIQEPQPVVPPAGNGPAVQAAESGVQITVPAAPPIKEPQPGNVPTAETAVSEAGALPAEHAASTLSHDMPEMPNFLRRGRAPAIHDFVAG